MLPTFIYLGELCLFKYLMVKSYLCKTLLSIKHFVNQKPGYYYYLLKMYLFLLFTLTSGYRKLLGIKTTFAVITLELIEAIV